MASAEQDDFRDTALNREVADLRRSQPGIEGQHFANLHQDNMTYPPPMTTIVVLRLARIAARSTLDGKRKPGLANALEWHQPSPSSPLTEFLIAVGMFGTECDPTAMTTRLAPLRVTVPSGAVDSTTKPVVCAWPARWSAP